MVSKSLISKCTSSKYIYDPLMMNDDLYIHMRNLLIVCTATQILQSYLTLFSIDCRRPERRINVITLYIIFRAECRFLETEK